MRCVKISNKRRVKKWGKSTKIWGNFKLKYIKLETRFWQTLIWVPHVNVTLGGAAMTTFMIKKLYTPVSYVILVPYEGFQSILFFKSTFFLKSWLWLPDCSLSTFWGWIKIVENPPPCHTSKVVSWHVHWKYEPYFMCSHCKT